MALEKSNSLHKLRRNFGRPNCERPITRWPRLIGKKIIPGRGIDQYRGLAESLWKKALEGDSRAQEILLKRVEGKIRNVVDINVDRGLLLVASPLFPATLEQGQVEKSIETAVARGQLAEPSQRPRLILDFEPGQAEVASGEVSNGL